MKLQRSTLILVGIAFLLGSGVLITEAQRARTPDSTAEQATGEPLLPFTEDDVVALEVQRPETTLAFERDADGAWQMVRPDQAPAEEGAIAFLLSQILRDGAQQQITITPDQQEEFGFLSPAGQVEITLEDGTSHTLVLGGQAFSGDALYALVDPPSLPLPEDAGETPVYVVSQNLANGVERPLEEWKMATAPPEAEADTEEADTEEAEPPEAEDTAAPEESPDSEEQPEADLPEPNGDEGSAVDSEAEPLDADPSDTDE